LNLNGDFISGPGFPLNTSILIRLPSFLSRSDFGSNRSTACVLQKTVREVAGAGADERVVEQGERLRIDVGDVPPADALLGVRGARKIARRADPRAGAGAEVARGLRSAG
jgi:hypothetical protein